MIIKMKYVGTGENNTKLTQNNDYVVLGFYSGPTFITIGDNGEIYLTDHGIQVTAQWQLVSVTDVGAVQVYP